MAKKYEKVLLIDLDLHKPACRKIMDHENPAYYTHDVILGKVALKDAVKTDKLSRVDMLFARHCSPETAGDLVHSQGLVQMLVVTEKQYARMEYVVGERHCEVIDSDERTVFL